MCVASGAEASLPQAFITPSFSSDEPITSMLARPPFLRMFNRTYTNDGTGLTGAADSATVSSFRLDEYLVTVGRFRQFANVVLPPDGGTGWLPLPGSGKHVHLNNGNGLTATGGGYEPGWGTNDDSNIGPTNGNLASFPSCTWTNTEGGQEFLPINCVNWYEAYAFCIWDGGFLPSEAEWGYAAAGGSQQREYPWGSVAPGTANQYAIYGCYYPSGSGSCTGVTSLAPVGTAAAGANLWGQLDLSGEAFEWGLDWYVNAYVDPCMDCAVATAGSLTSERVARGASFDDVGGNVNLQAGQRNNFDPHTRDPSLGFRCARIP
jgi:sulfatase modifying factor 1